MLPRLHNRAYQEFLTLLEKFQTGFLNIDTQIEIFDTHQEFQLLQQWFQQHIVSLTEEALDEAISSRWQSIQTEVKREFRLLATDILFFASSRQAATREKRIKAIGDRSDKLIRYCRIMLSEEINK